MTARGKPGKPKAGFPPFPPSLESPHEQRASHIPTASTTGPYIKERLSKASLAAGPKTVISEGGPQQTAEVGQNHLPNAALLLKSLWRLESVKRGFQQDHLLTMQVWLPKSKYPDRWSIANFYREVVHRLDAVPGIRKTAAVNFRPFQGMSSGTVVEIRGQTSSKPGEGPLTVEYRVATPGYLQALGVPFRKGRDLTESDGPESAGAVVINETASQRLFPNEDPIGKQIRPQYVSSSAPWSAEQDVMRCWLTVVRVVANIKEKGLSDRDHSEIYLSYKKFPSYFMFLVVRTEIPPANVASSVRNEVLAVDHDQPVSDVR